MELDITDFTRDESPRDFSASRVELGEDAGAITWRAACETATDYAAAWMPDDATREAVITHFLGYGAWSRDELEASDLGAMLIQDISGALRDCEFPDWPERFTPEWWEAYERASAQGVVSGRIFRGDEGRIYFYVGE